MSFEIQKATRVGINPLIAIYSESGCGKTMSALLLARGLAGPDGKIVAGDSESRRASLYADVIPGGFETFDIGEPFTPARYVEAVDVIEESGAAVGIIDSGSHEWEGAGGVLDIAAEIESKSGRAGLHCWRSPKFEHAKFVARLLRIKIPLIVCLRAKYKSRQTKDANGKTVIVKDAATSPIQAEDFIFESTCHFEILPNHSIIVTKCSHPDLRKCFPDDKTTPIEIRHGAALAAWCKAAGGGTVKSNPTDTKELKSKLWNILKTVRGAANDWKGAEIWLAGHKIITAEQTVAKLTAAQLVEAIEKSEIAMSDIIP